MSKPVSIALRVIGALLVLGLLAGGAAMAYRAGYARGLADSPQWAEALKAAPAAPAFERGFHPGFESPMFRGGYSPMMGRGHFGFFPFGGLLGLLLVAFFFFFGVMRFIFRPRWAHGYWHGPYPPEWGTPPWAQQPPSPQSPPAQPEAPQTNQTV